MPSSFKEKTTRIFKEAYSVFNIGSIQSVIVISFTSVTLLAMIFIGIAFYSTFSENAEKNALSSMQQIMNQATINLEYYLKSMIDVTDVMQKNMDESTADSTDKLEQILDLTLALREDFVSVSVYNTDGLLLLTTPAYELDMNENIISQSWFAESVNEPEAYFFEPPHVQRLFADRRPWVISLNHGIDVDPLQASQDYIVKVDMNFRTIDQLCSQVVLGKRGYIYIIDAKGNIIYHPQQQLIYAGLKDENIKEALVTEGSFIDDFQGEKRITTVQSIEYSGWKMVGISYVNEIVENRQNFNQLIIVILLFGIVFITIASFFISYKISQPIKRLEHQMNKIERGDFNIDSLEVKGEDEVKQLTKAFNIMILRIKNLMKQIVSEQESIRKSELKALQAQINPHFLYNTLDSIIWMNENKNYDGVTDMVSALAKLFRISLSHGKEIISIKDEIEHVRSYLIIQKIRYKNKFNYQIDIPEELENYLTVKLILQPIVENAIYHGINKIEDKGLITISVQCENMKIHFIITDNGYGIDKNLMESILTSESSSESSSGVGLKNVNERIKLSYGEEYGITLKSEEDVGTTVTISIPVVEQEKS
ncbi:MAG: sensor histidine kinase [Clostridia bacterium]|nr:sensor histidine kinase [Clostridia bacterium]